MTRPNSKKKIGELIMATKIIKRKAINVHVHNFNRIVRTTVVCNDGKIFRITDDKNAEWEMLRDIPQD